MKFRDYVEHKLLKNNFEEKFDNFLYANIEVIALVFVILSFSIIALIIGPLL